MNDQTPEEVQRMAAVEEARAATDKAEQDRVQYQKDYFEKVTKPKRKAAAALRKAEKAKTQMLSEAGRERLEREAADRAAVERAHDRYCRETLIVGELDGTPLLDETLEDGSSYLAWFWKEVDAYIRELRLQLAPHDIAALWNGLSMTEAGRAILQHFGIPALDDAGWHRYEFAPQSMGNGIIRTIKPRLDVPERLEQLFSASGAVSETYKSLITRALEDREGLEHTK